jgi:hypothetical protein
MQKLDQSDSEIHKAERLFCNSGMGSFMDVRSFPVDLDERGFRTDW